MTVCFISQTEMSQNFISADTVTLVRIYMFTIISRSTNKVNIKYERKKMIAGNLSQLAFFKETKDLC